MTIAVTWSRGGRGAAGIRAALYGDIAAGLLADTGDGALSRLIGRPTTPLVDGLRALARTGVRARRRPPDQARPAVAPGRSGEARAAPEFPCRTWNSRRR